MRLAGMRTALAAAAAAMLWPGVAAAGTYDVVSCNAPGAGGADDAWKPAFTHFVVVLPGREDGRWHTFADARANTRGRWRTSYPFRGIPGSYPVRARIRRQPAFPFELGHSRRLVVRVR